MKKPAVQAAQVVLLVVAEMKPALQFVQVVLLAVLAARPAIHAVQLPLPAVEKKPAEHEAQKVWPDKLENPAGHVLQTAVPVEAVKKPGSQPTHRVLCELPAYNPTPQAKQAVPPALGA